MRKIAQRCWRSLEVCSVVPRQGLLARGWLLVAGLALCFWLGLGLAAAQEPFPGEPAHLPKHTMQQEQQVFGPVHPPLPSQQDPGVLRVTTNLVLVPTLVEGKDGSIIYDLKASDFSVYDDGQLQQAQLDENMDSAPIALLVCVERGRDAPLVAEEIHQLGILLQLFAGGGHTQFGLVTFDSLPTYMDAFSPNPNYVEQDLANMPTGDGGAAILDAVGYSLDLLEHQPSNERRVLLLVSETRDHGSVHMNIPSLVQRIGQSNTLVLSLAFSPVGAELRDWRNGGGTGGSLGLLAPLIMTYNAFRKNVPKALADMTGGEYMSFGSDKRFQMNVLEMANHVYNRYLLSFVPTNTTPGLHHLRVELNNGIKARVIARTSYWATAQTGYTPANLPTQPAAPNRGQSPLPASASSSNSGAAAATEDGSHE